MTRLTQRVQTGTLKGEAVYTAYKNDTEDDVSECFKAVLNRLADYEDTGLTPEEIDTLNHTGGLTDLLETIKRLTAERDALQARLEKAIELPCKVGDSLYYVHNDEICEEKVVSFNNDEFRIVVELTSGRGYRNIKLIGKTIFLTRKEAENALKECDGGDRNT